MKRTWLITGAASGLGRELSSRLSRRGERLVLWDRDADRLDRTRGLLGPAVVHHEIVDVTSPESTREAAHRSADVAGHITNAIHCAGILRVGPSLAMSATDYRAMIEVNYLGTVYLARAIIPHLLEASRPSRRSQLAFVASVAGLRGVPALAGYSASKHAVIGFAQALRDELDPRTLDLRVVCPPPLSTPMVTNLPELPAVYRLSPPRDAARVSEDILAALESSDFMVLVGARTKLLWHMQRALPSGLDWALRRAAKR